MGRKKSSNQNQIRLSSGKLITFNSDQIEAIRLINEWIIGNEQFFTLSGNAGTGKTTCLKKVVENFNGIVVVSAPTHKAKKVIASTTNIPAQTLHSLLGLRPDVDLDSFNPNKPEFNPIAEQKITEYDLVIIDESSMINNELFNLIKDTIIHTNTKVLFMGDPAQLPPVGEKESVVFFQEGVKTFHLTKVERQNLTNPLSLVYTDLRDNLDTPDGGYIRKTVVNNKGEGIYFTWEKEVFSHRVNEIFSSPEYKKDSDFSKIIAWRNDTVRKSNKAVRRVIFGENAEFIEVGEVLTAYRSVQSGKSNYNLIENSADYRVIDKLEREKNMYGIWGFRVKIQENIPHRKSKIKDIFIVDITDHENLHNYGDQHDRYREFGKQNRMIGGWHTYYEFRRHNILMKTIDKYRDGSPRSKYDVIVKDIDYGYSITCHKSQGSTYTHVFVLETDMDVNWLVKERNQLKYTSLTSPKMTATVLTSKSKIIEHENMEIQWGLG